MKKVLSFKRLKVASPCVTQLATVPKCDGNFMFGTTTAPIISINL
jgi:hypothetical protein